MKMIIKGGLDGDIKEKTADEIEWLFTFNFNESNCYNDDYLHRTVKLYAKSKEEAFNKLNTLEFNGCNSLSWSCEEVRR